MIQHPLASTTSTNQLRGYPISGRILAADMDYINFDPEARWYNPRYVDITLRIYENDELSEYLVVGIYALRALIIDGYDEFQLAWPSDKTDHWTKSITSDGEWITIQGGYGGGKLTASRYEWSLVLNKLRELPYPKMEASDVN